MCHAITGEALNRPDYNTAKVISWKLIIKFPTHLSDAQKGCDADVKGPIVQPEPETKTTRIR